MGAKLIGKNNPMYKHGKHTRRFLKCKSCSKEYLYDIVKGGHFGLEFCSPSCRTNFLSKLAIGENAPNYKNGKFLRELRLCQQCGKEYFFSTHGNIGKGGNKFCSKDCKNEVQKLNFIGENNPNYGNKYSKESRILIEESSKKRWKNPEFVKKISNAYRRKPTKPEWILGTLLDTLFPDEYQYVGNFEFCINGKNPDFLNINGKKKLIELFGNYWHKGQNPQDRINHFKAFGFDTLVIWESELKNEDEVKNKLMKFAG